MIKILGVKIVWCVRGDVWCGDVVSFSAKCRLYVDGVVYWLWIDGYPDNQICKFVIL
jgi:hypothetical protein